MNRYERRTESRQMAQEGRDWFACMFWAIILTALVLGAVFGHGARSVAHGQAEQMPELRTDLLMPYVAR